MKRLLICATVLFILSSCNRTGSVKGNVYWKYNNFVGNKPDAGSGILLIRKEKPFDKLEAVADVAGNFNFDNVPIGDYLLIANSKNTTASNFDQFKMLLRNRYYLNEIFKMDLSHLPKDYYDRFIRFDSLFNQTLYSRSVYDSKEYKQEVKSRRMYADSLNVICDSLIFAINNGTSFPFSIILNKIDISSIKVKSKQTTTSVIDFGITYF